MDCAFCGKMFTGRKRKFCSDDCCDRSFGRNPLYKPEPNCLSCGKELKPGQKKYCSNTCSSYAYHKRNGGLSMDQLKEKRKGLLSKKEKEQRDRDLLTDRMVKRIIYIGGKGTIKYSDITPEIIIAKRMSVLARREKQLLNIASSLPIVTYRNCKICGVELINRHGFYCGDECRKKKERDRYYANRDSCLEKAKIYHMASWSPPLPFKCQWCGNVHQPEYGDTKTKYCSYECSVRAGRLGNHGSSLKRLVAESRGDRFKREEIYLRDKWVCQICHKKVNKKLKYPHPMSPSIDHILPIAQGGTHTKDNVQLAHLECNVKLGVNGIKQLKIFG